MSVDADEGVARRARLTFGVLTLVGFAGSVPLWWVVISASHRPAGGWVSFTWWPALVLAFMASEFFPLRVEIKSTTTLVPLVEIPVIVGIFSGVMPVLVGAANLTAALIASVVRRYPFRAMVLNTALVAVESGVLLGIYTWVNSRPDQSASWLFLAAYGGILAGSVVSISMVTLAHRLTGDAESLGANLRLAFITSTLDATVALMGVVLWRADFHQTPVPGKVLCLALVIAFAILYRAYSRFLREKQDLQRMYEFGRRVTDLDAEHAGWVDILERVRDQLNAKVAMLRLPPSEEGQTSLCVGPDGVMVDQSVTDDDALVQLTEGGESVAVSRDRSPARTVLTALTRRRARDVLAVPLGSNREGGAGHLEVRDRRTRWGRFTPSDLRVLETMAQNVVALLDNRRLVRSLRHEAYFDAITGLSNARGLLAVTAAALESGDVAGMVLLHLGSLHEVNNAMGHDRGEQLLVLAGRRVEELAGPGATVARLDSDRFAVLLRETTGGDVERTAAVLVDGLSQPFALEGIDVEPSLHAGVALLSTGGDEPEEKDDGAGLLQRAEMALTAAQSSDTKLRIYSATVGDLFRRRFQLVTQFRRAVDEGLVTVHYQPKMSLSDRKLVGVEALVRWNHPDLGPVSPAEFVEAIEATGSIEILLEHVLDIVLAQIRQWSDRSMKVGVAVNLSVRNLSTPNFPSYVARALREHGVAPQLLTFEITESSVMADPERSLPVLRELHSLGIQLSVDDFGTGYSSLAYLRRLPIDEIKIDRSFVQGMITDLGDLAIVRAIIDLGHSLGLRVVAEGVEEEAARDALRTLHCDDMQGFLLSRPIPIEKLEAWFQSRTMHTSASEAIDPQVLRMVTG